MLGRIVATGLFLLAQCGSVLAAAPLEAAAGGPKSADNRTEQRLAQARADAETVTGTITIIYKKPNSDCRAPKIKRDGECVCPKGLIPEGDICKRPIVITIDPPRLDDGTQGTPYGPVTLNGRGGRPIYSFAVDPGNLPPGLKLSTSGRLAGLPTRAGSYRFIVTALDADGYSGQRAYLLSIAPPPKPKCTPPMFELRGECVCPEGQVRQGNRCSKPIVIDIYPYELPGGTQGQAYPAQALQAEGGRPSYTFDVAGGSIPAGMRLGASGVLVGTPQRAGAYQFTARATDRRGSQGTRKYVLSIAPPPKPKCTPPMFEVRGACTCPEGQIRQGDRCTKPVTVEITPSELPGGTQDEAYAAQTLTGEGGQAPYAFALNAGALPPGMTVFASGVFSGTPSKAGSFSFTVIVTDARGNRGTQDYVVVIAQGKCAPGMYRDDEGNCQCKPGTKRFGLSSTCIPDEPKVVPPPSVTPCSGDLQRIEGRCQCEGDLVQRGTKCTTPKPDCRGDLQYIRGRCRCPGNLVQRGNSCERRTERCRGDLKRIRGRCRCPRGRVRRGNSCDRPRCRGDLVRIGGRCRCPGNLIQRGIYCDRRPRPSPPRCNVGLLLAVCLAQRGRVDIPNCRCIRGGGGGWGGGGRGGGSGGVRCRERGADGRCYD